MKSITEALNEYVKCEKGNLFTKYHFTAVDTVVNEAVVEAQSNADSITGGNEETTLKGKAQIAAMLAKVVQTADNTVIKAERAVKASKIAAVAVQTAADLIKIKQDANSKEASLADNKKKAIEEAIKKIKEVQEAAEEAAKKVVDTLIAADEAVKAERIRVAAEEVAKNVVEALIAADEAVKKTDDAKTAAKEMKEEVVNTADIVQKALIVQYATQKAAEAIRKASVKAQDAAKKAAEAVEKEAAEAEAKVKEAAEAAEAKDEGDQLKKAIQRIAVKQEVKIAAEQTKTAAAKKVAEAVRAVVQALKEMPKKTDLENFLNATNDEVRLKYADNFAKDALSIPDMRDSSYFRLNAMKRELTDDLDYKRQRDHAAHTLYNYLLGWYFLDNSKKLKEALRSAIEKRLKCSLNEDKAEFSDDNLMTNFGDIWVYASLLHDIGYILEGTIESLSTEVENERVTRGAALIHDFFNHRFWRDIDIDFHTTRMLMERCKLHIPDFNKVRSLAAMGDYLCAVGDCEPIRRELKLHNDKFKDDYRLDLDTFKLWEMHYEHFGFESMVDKIHGLGKVYKHFIWTGMKGGLRNLDHGVCSGLIGLMYSTFFYQLYFGMKELKELNDKVEVFKQRLETGLEGNETSEEAKTAMNDLEKFLLELKEKKILSNYDLLKRQIADWWRVPESPKEMPRDRYHSYTKNKSKTEYRREQAERIINNLKKQIDEFLGRENISQLIRFVTNTAVPWLTKKRGGYKASWWWEKVLWATAATALHNIPQQETLLEELPNYFYDKDGDDKRLKLKDDPLAYLGILVDILQEWDRYRVRKDTILQDTHSLQASEVDIWTDGVNVKITFPKKKQAEEVAKALRICLYKWDAIVDITSKEGPIDEKYMQ